MSRYRLSTRAWDRIIWAMVLAILISVAGTNAFGKIEGYLWPVLADGEITQTREEGYQTLFKGKAVKLRNCTLQEMRWYMVDAEGNQVQIPLILLERRKMRPLGPFEFGEWAVPIAPSELLRHTIGVARHTCHIGFPTISTFFDGRKDPIRQ